MGWGRLEQLLRCSQWLDAQAGGEGGWRTGAELAMRFLPLGREGPESSGFFHLFLARTRRHGDRE